jgi:hypothetical protein
VDLGPRSYAGLLQTLEMIHGPTHEEYEDMLDGLGSTYDSEALSVDEVNRRLTPLPALVGVTPISDQDQYCIEGIPVDGDFVRIP